MAEAERWGDQELQPVPRRLFRYGVATDSALRRAIVRRQGLPAPDILAAAMRPLVSYYTRTIEADGRRATDAAIRADLAALPAMLARRPARELFAEYRATVPSFLDPAWLEPIGAERA